MRTIKRRRRIVLRTSSMGVLIAAKGQSAKMINADMKNPNVNRDVMCMCSKIATGIIVRKPTK